MVLSRSELDFGIIAKNSSKQLSVVVSNYNPNTLLVTVQSNNPDFILSTSTLTISSGTSQNLNITLSSNNIGLKSGIITLNSNDPETPQMIINVLGEIINSQVFTSFTNYNFESVALFDENKVNLIIKNISPVELKVSDIIVNNSNFKVSSKVFTLQSNQEQIIEVSFNPQIIGGIEGSLLIKSNAQSDILISLLGNSVSAGIFVNKSSIDFGDVTIKTQKTETFLISNISEKDVDLIISEVASTNKTFKEFFETFRIKKGNALQVQVTFVPTIITQQTGKLLIYHNDIEQEAIEIDLKGRGVIASNIQLSTNYINFGSSEVYEVSKKTFRIYNTGSSVLNILNITTNNDLFSVTPTFSTITVNNFKEFEVSFIPNSNEQVIGKIQVSSNDPDSSNSIINLSGIGISPIIEVSDTLVDFGNITLQTSKENSFTIYNKSNLDLTISKIEVFNTSFEINEIFPIVIKSYKEIKIKFQPLNIGEVSSKIIIYSNDLSKPITEIQIKAIGVTPDIFILPSSLNFGDISLGDTVQLPVSISNLGIGNLKISSIKSSNSNFYLNYESLEIPSKRTENVKVFFKPISEGTEISEIEFNNNDLDSPKIIVPVTGYGSVPVFNISTTSLEFGTVVVDGMLEKNIVITNLGRSTLNIDFVNDSNVFLVSGNSLSIGKNSSKNIKISFSPKESLNYQENIIIQTNDPQNPIIQLEVKGIGIFAPRISVTPRNINFGAVQMKKSKQINILISNTGTQLLNFRTSIESSARLQTFSISPVEGSVQGSNKTTLISTFNPSDPQSLSGILKIFSNDLNEPTIEINLAGVGQPATLEWQKINSCDWIPKEVTTIAHSVTSVISPLITALDFTKQIFDIIKVFIIDLDDVMKIALEKIKKTIDDFIGDLSESGLYTLYILPGKPGITPFLYPQYFKDVSKTSFSLYDPNEQSWFDSVKGGYSAFISKVVQSFDDPGDGNRPQFSDKGMVGGFVMMFDSGTIGPDDIGKFLQSLQKLMKLFRTPFKMAFEPPTNVLAFSSNKQIKVTFSPSVSILPKEYFIFRSEIQGGEPVIEEGSQVTDENGKPIFKYKLVGVINVVEQFAKILGVSEKNARNFLGEVGYGVKQIANKFLGNDPLRFVFEDNFSEVNDPKTYYYIVVAGYSTLNDKNYSSIINNVYTSDFEKKITKTHQEIPSKKTSETKILSIGNFSAEVSAKLSNVFLEVKGGIARCKNFSCGFGIPKEIEFIIEENIPDFYNIPDSPLPGSVKIFIETEDENKEKKQFEVPSSKYRVDYSPRFDDKSNSKIFEGVINKIYFKSKNYFKKNDKIKILYETQKKLEKEKSQIELKTLSNDQTFLTDRKPIDSSSVSVKYLDQKIEFVVLNEKDGKIKVFKTPGSKVSVEYEYFKDFSEKDYFKCIRSEFNRYFFDVLKCDNGTNLCPGYENANCMYNNGGGCTFYNNNSVSEVSNRTSLIPPFLPENIPFSDFWDPIACQNGMMKQRCDGYNKTYPREVQKVWPDWSSINLSAISLFPKIEEIMTVLDGLLDSLLAGTEKLGTASTSFIDLLQKKIDQLKEILQKVNSFITILTEDFNLPDLYFLNIPYASGGNEYLKTSIQNSQNGPFSDSEAYTAGVVLVYGTPGLGNALKLFFGD